MFLHSFLHRPLLIAYLSIQTRRTYMSTLALPPFVERYVYTISFQKSGLGPTRGKFSVRQGSPKSSN